jgi:orotidine-5'-phosphate decarboxylase
MTFADRLQSSIVATRSHLVAGCDPVIEKLPGWLLDNAGKRAKTDAEFVDFALGHFADVFLAAVHGRVAAIKPNIAFFEQYGVPGLVQFARLCEAIRAKKIPLIIDAKRGDIGSTATAYSTAFLGRFSVRGRQQEAFGGDAVTVNPYLGFDTLEPFLEDCRRYGKGIFVLVKTSNPGSRAIQGLESAHGTVSVHVARWIAEHAHELAGACGWSGLGAVVGAPYPDEARALRSVMPNSFFLIPGFGAQGGKAEDAAAGFGVVSGKKGGAIVNVSRGLLDGVFSSEEELLAGIRANANTFNESLNGVVGG